MNFNRFEVWKRNINVYKYKPKNKKCWTTRSQRQRPNKGGKTRERGDLSHISTITLDSILPILFTKSSHSSQDAFSQLTSAIYRYTIMTQVSQHPLRQFTVESMRSHISRSTSDSIPSPHEMTLVSWTAGCAPLKVPQNVKAERCLRRVWIRTYYCSYYLAFLDWRWSRNIWLMKALDAKKVCSFLIDGKKKCWSNKSSEPLPNLAETSHGSRKQSRDSDIFGV